MAEVLEKLVNGLSLEERHSMLQKLQALAALPPESLYPVSSEPGAEPGLEDQYAALPWYYRLYYFILGLFKNRVPKQLFLNSRIGKLGRRIDLEYPQFYNSQKALLLGEFHRFLSTLKGDARFFFDALDVSVNRDRGGFFAFLGSLEMPGIHRKLEAETEPSLLRAGNPSIPEAELRQAALRVMEEALGEITEAQRTTMYRNARSLYCLKELASFLYDRVLLAFSAAEGEQNCSVYVVKDMLGSLNNILFSLRDPPSLPLLESLFIFILQERLKDPDFDRNQELQRLLRRAERALSSIRNFNRRLPLTLILKCGNRDMAYCPRQISGGEDWYAMYRDYWKRYVNSRFSAYLKERRHRELGEACQAFFRGEKTLALNHALSEEDSAGFPLDQSLSLSFLLSFYKLVFVPEIDPCLQPLMAEGEFLKKENRAEFAGAYNDLAGLGADIEALDGKIGNEGIYGERYAQARQEMSALPVKRRKIQLVLEDASGEGRAITERARGAIGSITGLIGGILKQEPGGRYDSLSNISQLEKKIPDLQEALRKAGELFKESLRILDDAVMLETEAAKS
jgi:hypothetical protein